MNEDADDPSMQDRLAELRASAKGWHSIQLAALGFIGLCGVIQTGDGSNPHALQVFAGVMVLVAFGLACWGIVLVGRAAWPLYRGETAEGGARDVAVTSRLLTRGLVLTFLSIAALALGTATSWWPSDDGDAAAAPQVLVRTSGDQSACGELTASSQPGTLRVVNDGRPLLVSLDALASVAPAESC